jgi:hypothetical protein
VGSRPPVLRGPSVDPMAPTSPVVPRGAGRNRSGRAPHAPPPALLNAVTAVGVDEASPAANVGSAGGGDGGNAAAGVGPKVASLAGSQAVEVAVGAGAEAGPSRSVPTTSATRGAGRRLLAGVGLLLETSASAALTGGSGSSALDQRPRSATEGGIESSLPATDTSGTLNGAGSHRTRGNAPPSFVKAKKQRSEESGAVPRPRSLSLFFFFFVGSASAQSDCHSHAFPCVLQRQRSSNLTSWAHVQRRRTLPLATQVPL